MGFSLPPKLRWLSVRVLVDAGVTLVPGYKYTDLQRLILRLTGRAQKHGYGCSLPGYGQVSVYFGQSAWWFGLIL